MTERFSAARMEPYLDAAGGDGTLAARLYHWNIRIGAAFFEDIGVVEVLLRNALDGALRDHFQSGTDETPWYDRTGVLLTTSYKAVDGAKDDVRRYTGMGDDREPDQDDVTARLGFGFWLMLLNRNHAVRVGPIFRQCFLAPSGRPIHPDDVSTRAEDLGELRNAIAHHHPIFNWDFTTSATYVSEIAGWISQPIRAWLMSQSRVSEVLEKNPLQNTPA
jgi:hypothetical protein